MRFAHLGGLVMVVALATSGCGTSKEPANVSAQGGGDFCETARTQAETLLGDDDGALQGAMAQIFDPSKAKEGRDALKAYVQTAKAENAQFVAKAPAELKKDLAVINDFSDKLFDAFSKADYDITKIDVGDLSATETPELEAATERLKTYLKKSCDLDVGSNG